MVGKIIVGDSIFSESLIEKADKRNLKNSTFDLTIGEIIPVGRENVLSRKCKDGCPPSYFIEPREMIFILAKEEFNLPGTVTGLATLRTTFTKKGLLSLNVGIIDPFFKGPISTTLINFSDRPVEVSLGDKFFRVIFFEHEDVMKYKPKSDESVERDNYIKNLENKAYSEFPQTYLSSPRLDNAFYRQNFKLLLTQGILHTWPGRFIGLAVIMLIYQTWPDLIKIWEWIKNLLP